MNLCFNGLPYNTQNHSAPALFGTDGIRGVANTQLRALQAFYLGQASGLVFGPTLVIGRDTRMSGPLLQQAFQAGALSFGAHIFDIDVMPTPALALLTVKLQAHAGVVISASHNPPQYNGIKFFDHKGHKLSAETERLLECLAYDLEHGNIKTDALYADGVYERFGNASQLYHEILLERLKNIYSNDQLNLSALKIVVDAAWGASSFHTTQLLKNLGATVIALNESTSKGDVINVGCGSNNLSQLQEAVCAHNAHMGIAHDGDADRVIFVDELGQEVNGDAVLAIIARELKEKALLHQQAVVATCMSNLGLEQSLQDIGVQLYRTAVGDKYVAQQLRECGAALGGEQSGHIIIAPLNSTGDGLACALMMSIIVNTQLQGGTRLSALSACMQPAPQVLINVHVNHKDACMNNKCVQACVQEIEQELQHTGRVLLRPSGTEPLIRVMVEAQDELQAQACACKLAQLIESLS